MWLSNALPTVGQPLDNNTLYLCDQHRGRIQALDSVILSCPWDLPLFRYIIIQSPLDSDAICLAEVEVLVGRCLIYGFYFIMHSSIVFSILVLYWSLKHAGYSYCQECQTTIEISRGVQLYPVNDRCPFKRTLTFTYL